MTRITTKKALRIRKELETLVKAPALPLVASLSVYVSETRETPDAPIARAAKALQERIERQDALSRILCDLRIAVAKANVEADVERLLAQAAHVDRRIALEKQVAGAAPTPETEETLGRAAQAYRTITAEESYSRKETVDVSVVSEAMRADAARRIADLRREKERLDDERTASNAVPRIEIAEADAVFLRELGLL